MAFLDADDLWNVDKLVVQMAALAENPGLDMVFGWTEQFISPELAQTLAGKIEVPAAPMPGYHIGAMLVTRPAFLRVGFFATDWAAGDFLDWYLKARELGLNERMLQQVLVRRRIHMTNLTRQADGYRLDYVHVLKAALDRRRRATRPAASSKLGDA